MALLEAMAMGVPCLVSPEVAQTLGSAPPVITLSDWRDGSGAVRAVLDDDDLLARTGAAGRRWALDHAGPVVVARATDAVYRGVLRGAGDGGRRLASVPARG